MTFGEKLLKLRKEQGLSQEGLAARRSPGGKTRASSPTAETFWS